MMKPEGKLVLSPRDPHSQELLSGITPGVDLMCKVWQPRNLQQHRRMMVLLSKIAENHPRYVRADQVLTDLKKLGGYFDEFEGVHPETGEVVQYMHLRSVSFYSMDQAEFAQFWKTAVHNIKTYLLPGIEETDLYRELVDAL